MNYGQGILLEETTAAYICGNHISRNIKANIALGGQDSEHTQIMFNHIEKSKQEGIFVVEGGQSLVIDSNIIMENQDGIVLLHSNGQLTNNKIIDNQRCGICLVSESTGCLRNNVIENN
jgi:F-box protein 11